MIKALKTDIAILAVLLGALFAQMPHAANVFTLMENNPAAPRWHSNVFSIALEFAVLLFVVNGCTFESYAFAVVSVAMNLAYYYKHGVHLFTVDALPAWLISIALPVAIARYSHLIAKHGGQDVAVHFDWRAWVQRAQAWVQRDGMQAETPVQVDADAMQTPAGDSADAPSLAQRAKQLKSEKLTNVQIGRELGVHRNKVTELLK